MNMALQKWRMMVTIIRLKCGQDDSNTSVEQVIEKLLGS